MTPYFQTRVELHHISFDVVASADYDPVQEVEEEEAESFPHSKPESFAITTWEVVYKSEICPLRHPVPQLSAQGGLCEVKLNTYRYAYN